MGGCPKLKGSGSILINAYKHVRGGDVCYNSVHRLCRLLLSLSEGRHCQRVQLCGGLLEIDVLPTPDGKRKGLEKIRILMGGSGSGRRKSEQ